MYYSTLAMQCTKWLYGLRFNPENNSISIDILSTKIDYLNNFFNKSQTHLSKEHVEQYGFKKFNFVINAENDSFGFNGVGRVEYKNDIVSISFLVLSKSKRSEFRKTHYFAVCQTLMILFKGLRFLMMDEDGKNTASPDMVPLQIFEVETISYKESHGHALQGFVHKSLRGFLKEMGELSYDEERKYRDTFRSYVKKIFGYEGQALLKFESTGGFLVQVPGSACDIGIYGEERSHPIEYGAPFQSHNVDASQQQIGLLVGLAMIIGWYYEKYPSQNYM